VEDNHSYLFFTNVQRGGAKRHTSPSFEHSSTLYFIN